MSDAGSDAFACRTEHDGHCITCSDEGIAMTIVALEDEQALATCEDAGGARCTIDVGLIEPVLPGATVLTHAGTAIAVLPLAEGTHALR